MTNSEQRYGGFIYLYILNSTCKDSRLLLANNNCSKVKRIKLYL